MGEVLSSRGIRGLVVGKERKWVRVTVSEGDGACALPRVGGPAGTAAVCPLLLPLPLRPFGAGLSPAARSPSLQPCSSLGFCTRGPGLVLGLTSRGQRGSAQPIGSSWSSGPSPGPAPSQRWLCTRPQTPSRWRGFHSACPLPLCHLNVTWCFSLICSVWGSCGGTCLLEKVPFEVASSFSSGKPPGP